MTATVGKNVSNEWETVYFADTFSADPVVLSQVQTPTGNDAEWVTTRQKNVGTTSFQVALEEAEVMTQAHGMEVVGWLAIDAGEGDWDGHDYPTPLRSGTPCGRKRAKRPMR
jgi:hypothetical protein